MSKALIFNGVFKCLHNMPLTDYIAETLGTPFAGDNLIFTHHLPP
jgi:hypothetical protein